MVRTLLDRMNSGEWNWRMEVAELDPVEVLTNLRLLPNGLMIERLSLKPELIRVMKGADVITELGIKRPTGWVLQFGGLDVTVKMTNTISILILKDPLFCIMEKVGQNLKVVYDFGTLIEPFINPELAKTLIY